MLKGKFYIGTPYHHDMDETAHYIRKLMKTIRLLRQEQMLKSKDFAAEAKLNKNHYSEMEWSGEDMMMSSYINMIKTIKMGPWTVMRIAWFGDFNFEREEAQRIRSVARREIAKKKRVKRLRVVRKGKGRVLPVRKRRNTNTKLRKPLIPSR